MVRSPAEHLAALRRLHRWLAVRVDLKLSAGGRVSSPESSRNAEEIAAVDWALSTLDRLIKKAREAREAREAKSAAHSPLDS